MSRAATAERSRIIESDAFRQVRADLEMYVDGAILGRSFLVAGHRGAGKTTMLHQAVVEVESVVRARGQSRTSSVRPLFITLHGPDLLGKPVTQPAVVPVSGETGTTPEEVVKRASQAANKANVAAAKATAAAQKADEAARSPNADSSATNPAAVPKQPPADELYHFLDRVTSGLYLGVAKEFARCFRNHVSRIAKYDAERADLLELAADLQVQLDRQPDLDRLRDYWARVGALDKGVLFEFADKPGRGVAEVTALFTTGRAMRTFTGRTDASLDTETKRDRQGSVSLMTVDGQSLLPTALGLATGAVVWNALPAADGSLLKVFSSILTGLGAVLALKISATRTRSTSQTWKEKFIFNDDPGALYRVLPELIERFQEVGLYPVFVVDELDKVPGLGKQINALLGYMKQFVTERAFFCFVANRSFYQQAQVQLESSAYSTLHTRFGDSVMVRYRPADFHTYLDSVLTVDRENQSNAEIEKSERARTMLRYVILSRCYLHPYDLRRELARWHEGGRLVETVDDILNSGRKLREVAMQVAVELVYEGDALCEYIRDPVWAQTALDALYYPLRKWREGRNELDVTRDTLTAYLVDRTGIQEELAAGEAAIAQDKLVPPALQTILVKEVERMMNLLCDPPALVAAAKADSRVPVAISKMLEVIPAIAVAKG